jgi:CheY-like chemotaxis protein/HPt (histidine-containing phosphotransfer) domain-containing protein
LVEDNILNQKLAEHIFKKWDITYKIANNGMRAIKMLEKEEFACILMDLHMPVINGIDATKIIRNVNSDVLNHQTPIIALTADAFEETRVLTSEAGMNYFLSKPFSQDSLLEALLKAVLNTTVDKVKIKRNISPKTEETSAQIKEKLINLNVIKELIGDDNESIIELLNEYIENAPKDYDDLITSLSQTELHKIQSSAHKIKSTFNTFGIKLLAERAKEIEFGAKEGISLERLNELCIDIKQHFFDTLEEAREILLTLK